MWQVISGETGATLVRVPIELLVAQLIGIARDRGMISAYLAVCDAVGFNEVEAGITDMQPGVHERQWELDSLTDCIRPACRSGKSTSDTSPGQRSPLLRAPIRGVGKPFPTRRLCV